MERLSFYPTIVLLAILVGLAVGTFSVRAEHQRVSSDTTAGSGPVVEDRIPVSGDIQDPALYKAFLRYLDTPDAPNTLFDSVVVRRQLRSLSVVLPRRKRSRFGIDKAAETGDLDHLSDGVGDETLVWWRRKDPFPATNRNERLIEHLERTAYAFTHYPREDDENRLDDRGKVYIRLGPPHRTREIHSDRKGKFWVYAFHVSAEYLFVRERGDGFMLGRPVDLVPDARDHHGYGPSRRGTRKSVEALVKLEKIYEALSHYRSRYGITYADLSMYNEAIRERRGGFSTPLSTRPHSFVRQTVEKIEQEEAEAQRNRAEVVPRTKTNVGKEYGELPIAVRWIRSLGPNGTTEMDVYWSVARTSLRPSAQLIESLTGGTDEPGSHYLLTASLVRYSGSYERRETRKNHLLVGQTEEERGVLPTQRESFLVDDSPHAALQVDAAWVEARSGREGVQHRGKLKTNTIYTDSLRGLESDDSELEISDLKPLLWSESDGESVASAPVYPFPKISARLSLGLSFEVYHLQKDEEGRTQFTIEYQVQRITDRGTIATFLLGEEENRTAVANTVEGSSTRTTEYILLDTESWDVSEAQTVRVTVRVEDKHTDKAVQRSIEFDMVG